VAPVYTLQVVAVVASILLMQVAQQAQVDWAVVALAV